MRYLLDTSALLSHYRQQTGWKKVQQLFESDEAELFLASVSVTEFARRLRELGANETETEEEIGSYQMLFTEIAAIDVATAKVAFAISCQTPSRLPLLDSLIAAAAQNKQAILVHRDEHMRTIPSNLVQQLDLDQ